MKFDEWLKQLDEEYARRGGDETGRPLSEQTGSDCWLDYFAEDVSPSDALDADWSHGQ